MLKKSYSYTAICICLEVRYSIGHILKSICNILYWWKGYFIKYVKLHLCIRDNKQSTENGLSDVATITFGGNQQKWSDQQTLEFCLFTGKSNNWFVILCKYSDVQVCYLTQTLISYSANEKCMCWARIYQVSCLTILKNKFQ